VHKDGCLAKKKLEACYLLGMDYARGEGTKKNLKSARQWLDVSCQFGIKKACNALKELERETVKVTPSINIQKSTVLITGDSRQYTADIDKDGKMETVAVVKAGSTELGDYYQLMVFDDNGAVLWKGPTEKSEENPYMFYSLDVGESMPALFVDFDLDGNVEMLAPMAQSDVSPTYYRKLRWRGDRFEPLLQSALMYDIGSNNRFVWKLALGVGGTWVSKLSRAKNGEIVAEITQMRDYGGVDMGSVSLVFDKKGATVKRVLRPPAKVGRDTVTSPFGESPVEECTAQAPVQRINTYRARISRRDHYNSRGRRLRNMVSILRQDRANYYTYGGDSEDQSDQYFATKRSRSLMERISIHPVGTSYRDLKDLVVNGNPLLEIEVESHRLNVRVIER
jgi:hypothetical protein